MRYKWAWVLFLVMLLSFIAESRIIVTDPSLKRSNSQRRSSTLVPQLPSSSPPLISPQSSQKTKREKKLFISVLPLYDGDFACTSIKEEVRVRPIFKESSHVRAESIRIYVDANLNGEVDASDPVCTLSTINWECVIHPSTRAPITSIDVMDEELVVDSSPLVILSEAPFIVEHRALCGKGNNFASFNYSPIPPIPEEVRASESIKKRYELIIPRVRNLGVPHQLYTPSVIPFTPEVEVFLSVPPRSEAKVRLLDHRRKLLNTYEVKYGEVLKIRLDNSGPWLLVSEEPVFAVLLMSSDFVSNIGTLARGDLTAIPLLSSGHAFKKACTLPPMVPKDIGGSELTQRALEVKLRDDGLHQDSYNLSTISTPIPESDQPRVLYLLYVDHNKNTSGGAAYLCPPLFPKKRDLTFKYRYQRIKLKTSNPVIHFSNLYLRAVSDLELLRDLNSDGSVDMRESYAAGKSTFALYPQDNETLIFNGEFYGLRIDVERAMMAPMYIGITEIPVLLPHGSCTSRACPFSLKRKRGSTGNQGGGIPI